MVFRFPDVEMVRSGVRVARGHAVKGGGGGRGGGGLEGGGGGAVGGEDVVMLHIKVFILGCPASCQTSGSNKWELALITRFSLGSWVGLMWIPVDHIANYSRYSVTQY